MQRYQEILSQLPPDTILLYRLGDFYEVFFDGAATVAKALNLTLTRRRDVPMAGIPYHALDSHVSELKAAELKVATVDPDQVDCAGLAPSKYIVTVR